MQQFKFELQKEKHCSKEIKTQNEQCNMMQTRKIKHLTLVKEIRRFIKDNAVDNFISPTIVPESSERKILAE